MFGLFKQKTATTDAKPELPMGFRLGGAVRIDNVMFRANAGAFAFDIPSDDQMIEALGSVDLGGGSHLRRLYLTDDAWIQLSMTGDDIDDMKLFVFAETRNPPTKLDFQRLAEAGSEIGQSSMVYAGHRYERVWSKELPGWVPPIVYDESVKHMPGGEKDFELTHYSMLYQREIPGMGERYEYLFLTLEDYSADEFVYVISLGCDLSSADLVIN
ncbi:MAG TPA: DUF2491 family protein [Dyella sp.]|jgi:hypothetical protein